MSVNFFSRMNLATNHSRLYATIILFCCWQRRQRNSLRSTCKKPWKSIHEVLTYNRRRRHLSTAICLFVPTHPSQRRTSVYWVGSRGRPTCNYAFGLCPVRCELCRLVISVAGKILIRSFSLFTVNILSILKQATCSHFSSDSSLNLFRISLKKENMNKF